MNYSPNKTDLKAEPEILALTKTLLSITDASKDALLKVHIGAVCQLIRNYIGLCDCQAISQNLYYLWADMTSKRYALAASSISDDGKATVKGKVNTVTDGSQSVSFGYGDASGSLVSSSADKDLLSGFKAQLDPYRQIRWC